MKNKTHSFRLIKLWWLIPLMTLVIVVLVANSQSGKIEMPDLSKIYSPSFEIEPEASPSDPHIPVFIRLGTIKEIGVDYIVLESKKLLGQGNELITVLITDSAPIIEIQIPSYMNKDLQELLNNGGDVIPRREVGFENLYIGQIVEVVSTSDMYGYKEVTAARLEYKIIMNTEV